MNDFCFCKEQVFLIFTEIASNTINTIENQVKINDDCYNYLNEFIASSKKDIEKVLLLTKQEDRVKIYFMIAYVLDPKQ